MRDPARAFSEWRAHKKCPACARARADAPPRAAGRIPPAGLWAKLHFVLFASMCVAGAAVIIDTGPFPLNFVLGAFAIVLPSALVIRRHRSLARARRNDAVGSVS